ncbi:MAG: mechanosensitive ion channel [Leptolyngbyaceae cyanobacterium SL_1_1]|nr:mechanosensitive ion channel [Leptolyngbyaceae cyanobacterium RM1_1_2]NJO11574.1 mechanosensitive ion channel [Leptolyngbyaceae cyanobacterium SL_1_1]
MKSRCEWAWTQLCCSRRYFRGLILLAMAIALVFLLRLPGIAQEEPNKASVILDGRPVLEVAATDELTAQERARVISERLAEAVTASGPLDITQDEKNKLPTLLLDGKQLLTITTADQNLDSYSTLEFQADAWSQQIERVVLEARNERSQGFLQRSGIISLGVLLIAAIAHWLSGRLWHGYLHRLLQGLTFSDPTDISDSHTPSASNLLLKGSLFLVRLGVWGGTLLYITNRFPFTRQWSYRFIDAFTNAFTLRSFVLGTRSFSILDLLFLLGLLLGLIVVSSAATNILRSRVLRITGINRGAQEAVAILAKYTLISLGTIVLLQVWGLDLSSLAILASALGVGIGLGLQNIAKDFGSGLVLVFERPIQVGDFVEFGEFMGMVERIGARSTEIKTLDQISIIVPNSRFLEQEVINWSHRNPISRIRLPVGVAYAADPQQVRQVLLEASRDNASVLSTPVPQVFFRGFGDSALDFELLVWIAEPSKQLVIKSDLYFAIEAQLRQHKIEIPFPQRDLNLRTGNFPIELSAEVQKFLTQFSQQSKNGR